MLEWQHPWFFALLIPVAGILVWEHRRRPSLKFSSLGLLRSDRSIRGMLSWLPTALLAASLVAGVAALARPQLTNRETVVTSQGIDIMLALDASGSMDSPDFRIGGREASRLDVAKAVIARFVQGRPNDRLGLVVFGEEAFTQVPLTLDHDALVGFLRQVSIGMAGPKSTSIGDGLAVAVKRLKDLPAPSRIIVLLTDGRNNSGRLTPDQAAQAASALGIKVYAVGVGGDVSRGGLFGLIGRRGGDLDETMLQGIASTTGGRYWRADDTEALSKIYQTIDQLEKSTAEVKEYVHRDELYRRWLLPSLALLLAYVLLSTTIFRRLP
jgi:Ca-activated chloride channel homolog